MDSRCHLFILLFMFSGFDNIRMSNIERDVIFTPNQTSQVAGKTLYYNPNEVTEIDRNQRNYKIDDYILKQNEENRWLDPLKHSLYLLLNNKINSNVTKSDAIREESIQEARFLELNNESERNSKFGDVINLVNGKLEKDPNGLFQLVEIHENCIKYCLEESFDEHNITAFWSIYKIRHRDDKRNYRYEWKISIRRLCRFDCKQNDEHNVNIRSFLFRDIDYPTLFDASNSKNNMIKMEKRIFNTLYDKSEHPFNLDYRYIDGAVQNLNIGEYYAKDTAPIIRYHIPNAQEIGAQLTVENENILHHHYFLNKDEMPIFKTSQYETVATIPGQINGPNFSNVAIPPSQLSLSRPQNQLDGYNEIVHTTSQVPFHFPNEVRHQEHQRLQVIEPTTYRGHYDDNRESILESEVKKNNYGHHHNHNQNQLITFPSRHANSFPISSITTTPSSHAINLRTSPAPSIQSLYNKQFTNLNSIYPSSSVSQNYANQPYWYDHHSHQKNFNFFGSLPYHENTYSELDPIYHGPLATPSDIPSSSITKAHHSDVDDSDDVRFVSQLPLQNENEDVSYDNPTEVHQTTSTNTDSTFTTPYNFVTTTQNDSSLSVNKSNPFPDSINAQLPPPDLGADIRVPYVETDKSIPRVKSNRNKNGKIRVIIKNESDNNSDDSDDLSISKFNIDIEKTTKKSLHNRYKNSMSTVSSTEKSSWAPKRPRLRNSNKYKTNSELVKHSDRKPSYANRRKITVRKPTTTTTTEATTLTQEIGNESNTVVTSTHMPLIEDEPRTKQSVQKSVSVHIAEKVTVMPKKSAKVVLNGKTGDGNKQKSKTIAKIKKVEKDIEDSTVHSIEQ